MTRIVVTGGAGLIGSAVCARLYDAGHDVTGTFWCTAPPDLGSGVEWRQVDLTDAGALSAVPAADAIPVTFDKAHSVAQTNRMIDDNVFEYVSRTEASLIYASSSSLYGDGPAKHPGGFRESDPIAADAPYQREKAWAEAEGRQVADRAGARFTALRINAPFGPRQRTQTVMRRFLGDARAAHRLRYYGEGSREQDFTYIDDVAGAFASALAGPGGVFNVSGGQPVSMRGLASLIAELAGLDPDLVGPAGMPDPQEGRRARFDLSAARTVLGWTPQTELREGISRCLARPDGSA
jgi:UDP-glucose 4-epimerase